MFVKVQHAIDRLPDALWAAVIVLGSLTVFLAFGLVEFAAISYLKTH